MCYMFSFEIEIGNIKVTDEFFRATEAIKFYTKIQQMVQRQLNKERDNLSKEMLGHELKDPVGSRSMTECFEEWFQETPATGRAFIVSADLIELSRLKGWRYMGGDLGPIMRNLGFDSETFYMRRAKVRGWVRGLGKLAPALIERWPRYVINDSRDGVTLITATIPETLR